MGPQGLPFQSLSQRARPLSWSCGAQHCCFITENDGAAQHQTLTLMARGCFLGTEDHNHHSSCHWPGRMPDNGFKRTGWLMGLCWRPGPGQVRKRLQVTIGCKQNPGSWGTNTEEYEVGSRHKFLMRHSTRVPVYCIHKCVYV